MAELTSRPGGKLKPTITICLLESGFGCVKKLTHVIQWLVVKETHNSMKKSNITFDNDGRMAIF